MNKALLHKLAPVILGTALVSGGLSVAAISATPLPVVPVKVGETLGTDQAAIASKLEAAGFSEFEFETEENELEVEATYENAEVEIEISMETGSVISVEIEAEDENDD